MNSHVISCHKGDVWIVVLIVQSASQVSNFQMKLFVVAVVTLFVTFAGAFNFTGCQNDVTILEQALYRPENVIQLNKIFYPPREPPTRFIKVKYEFEDIHKCNVTYIWAVGGFLLIQPPKIFQLTSLYFSTPANNLTDLSIKLPEECLPLALVGDSCTCDSKDNTLLDILTQQVANYRLVGTKVVEKPQ